MIVWAFKGFPLIGFSLAQSYRHQYACTQIDQHSYTNRNSKWSMCARLVIGFFAKIPPTYGNDDHGDESIFAIVCILVWHITCAILKKCFIFAFAKTAMTTRTTYFIPIKPKHRNRQKDCTALFDSIMAWNNWCDLCPSIVYTLFDHIVILRIY